MTLLERYESACDFTQSFDQVAAMRAVTACLEKLGTPPTHSIQVVKSIAEAAGAEAEQAAEHDAGRRRWRDALDSLVSHA